MLCHITEGDLQKARITCHRMKMDKLIDVIWLHEMFNVLRIKETIASFLSFSLFLKSIFYLNATLK